jgi:hypothetical protein
MKDSCPARYSAGLSEVLTGFENFCRKPNVILCRRDLRFVPIEIELRSLVSCSACAEAGRAPDDSTQPASSMMQNAFIE